MVAAALPVESTRLTVRVTVSTTIPVASSMKMPPFRVFALSVVTVVSRWLSVAPIAVPAVRIRSDAVMSYVLLSIVKSRILPAVAIIAALPAPAFSSPRVMLPVVDL